MSLEHRYYQGQEPITIYTPLLTGYLAPVLTFLSFWESEGGMRWVSVEVDMGECVAGSVRSGLHGVAVGAVLGLVQIGYVL